MQNLKSRLANLEQNGRGEKPIIVVVAPEETEAEAFARLGIDRAKLHRDQLVIIVDRGAASRPDKRQRIVKSAPFAPVIPLHRP